MGTVRRTTRKFMRPLALTCGGNVNERIRKSLGVDPLLSENIIGRLVSAKRLTKLRRTGKPPV